MGPMSGGEAAQAAAGVDSVAVHGPGDKPGLVDAFGRSINYIRLSLTDRCNFRCVYCMPEQGMPYLPHEQILSYEELLRLCRIFVGLGISRFKVTGGEPLCRRGAAAFIRSLVGLPGVEEVTLTTNGSLLEPHLAALAESGIRSLTFSCDALDPIAFQRISRSAVTPAAIVATMETAARLGLRVKINTVPLAGLNDAELVPLARFAMERGYQIRFIELMPVGQGRTYAGIPQTAVMALMEREFGPLSPVQHKTGNGPAVMCSVPGQAGLIGFIAALSHQFCDLCNRVRLTSTGFLKTCLYHKAGVELKALLRGGATDADLAQALQAAVLAKPKGHSFSFTEQAESEFFMHSVGG